MTSAAIIACIFNSLLGAVLPGVQSGAGGAGRKLPGPAEGGAEFRYAEAHCSLTPSVVRPGEEAALTVRLTPRAGATWHEARLVASCVEIMPPEGWTVQEPELALPAPESPGGPREFTVRLTPRAGEERGGQWERAAEGTGGEVLVLCIRYGVRVAGPKSSEKAGAERASGEREEGRREEGKQEDSERAPPSASPEVFSPEVIFEEATLAVELPAAALPAIEGEEGGGPSLPGGVASLPEPEALDDERGGPLLPSLFFALATAMVFAGLALWVRRRDSSR